MADGVVFSNVDDFNQMARAVAAVNRGGIEHPFNRRQLPIGVNDLVLLKSTETADILGPRASFIGGATPPGAKHTGKACIVDQDTGDYDETKEFDVDTSFIGPALVMPNADGTYPLNAQYLMWAISTGDTFLAVCGGTPAFEGEITTYETGDQYTVTPIIPGTATPIICESLFSESYVIGQRCWVQMQGSSPFITHSGCVP